MTEDNNNVEEVEEQEVPVSETQQELYEKQIKELKDEVDELKNERMTARRRATKAEKEMKSATKELEEELEMATNKAAIYFRKMREAQDQLADMERDVLNTIELTANGLSNVHQLLATSGTRLQRQFQKLKNNDTPVNPFKERVEEE